MLSLLFRAWVLQEITHGDQTTTERNKESYLPRNTPAVLAGVIHCGTWQKIKDICYSIFACWLCEVCSYCTRENNNKQVKI